MAKVRVEFGRTVKEYEVLEDPVPHILVDSKKELHGWWPGKRECTAERLLINPYNNCSIGCFCCYAKALPGLFQVAKRRGVVVVCRDFDRVVAEQLDSLDVVSAGYLSPVTDPFQPVNSKYRLSEKIIEAFVERNIPIEFITKSVVSDEVIELIGRQRHSFGQVSILTPDEELRRVLMSGGARTDELFGNLKKLASGGIHAVCRIDPVIPLLTDHPRKLERLVKKAVDCGAGHIVASAMDIPQGIQGEIFSKLAGFGDGLAYDLRKLYTERVDGSLHAEINYRKGLFDRMRNICDKAGVTFALCMEYEMVDGKPVGLNREFMSSTNCEGIDVPIYIRHGNSFEPAADCTGACLTCEDALCGVDDLAMGRPGVERMDFKLADYRRWGKERTEPTSSGPRSSV